MHRESGSNKGPVCPRYETYDNELTQLPVDDVMGQHKWNSCRISPAAVLLRRWCEIGFTVTSMIAQSASQFSRGHLCASDVFSTTRESECTSKNLRRTKSLRLEGIVHIPLSPHTPQCTSQVRSARFEDVGSSLTGTTWRGPRGWRFVRQPCESPASIGLRCLCTQKDSHSCQ